MVLFFIVYRYTKAAGTELISVPAKGKLETCRLKLQDKKLVITTDYEGDVTLEAMSIDEKGDFFEEIFGIRPVLKQKKKV